MALFEIAHRGVPVPGEQFSHSLWVTSSLTSAADLATAAAAHWASAFASAADTYWPDSTQWTSVHVSRVVEATGIVDATADASIVAVAGDSGNALPPQCAIVCTMRTALAGRSHRGRFYLPGPATGAVTNVGALDSTAQGVIADALQAYMVDLIADTYFPAVYSRTLHTHTVCSSMDVGNVFDTQRRRRDSLTEVRLSRAL